MKSESFVYVVSDISTDAMSGIESDKSFLSQSEILQVLQNTDGTPAASLNTANYATFPITSVSGYTDTSTSSDNWVHSIEGIAVLCTIGASIVLLATILIVYFLCTRERKYRFQSDKEQDKVAFVDAGSNKNNTTTLPQKEKIQNMVNPYKHPDGDMAVKKAKHIPVRPLPKAPTKQNMS
ncbi:hypothetical protein KUTeg_021054 [Tegillarca granosa]|uniref:Uncharacterized protein n=1 Tax=Tegillarca granosa TaxID=220873 RepID=A0ABQ9EEU0_TEGGR|nr:hypothetical protein KUTeg_021054 [Tegillarca granosa]